MSEHLKQLLDQVAAGVINPAAAYNDLKHFEDLGFVKIDHHRVDRKGFPEVIYGEGKTAEQITSIFQALIILNSVVLATRVSADKANEIISLIPELEYYKASRILLYTAIPFCPIYKGTIGIVCAGTSDLPIAEVIQLKSSTMLELLVYTGYSNILMKLRNVVWWSQSPVWKRRCRVFLAGC